MASCSCYAPPSLTLLEFDGTSDHLVLAVRVRSPKMITDGFKPFVLSGEAFMWLEILLSNEGDVNNHH